MLKTSADEIAESDAVRRVSVDLTHGTLWGRDQALLAQGLSE